MPRLRRAFASAPGSSGVTARPPRGLSFPVCAMGAGRGNGGAARWGGAGGGAGRGSGPPRRGLGRQCRRRVRAPDPAVSAERAGRAGVGVSSSPGLGRGLDPRSPRGRGTWPRAEPGAAPGRGSATAGPRGGSGPGRPRLGRAGPGEWAQRPREPAPPAGGWRAARRRGRGAPRPLILPGPTQRLGAQPLLPAPPPQPRSRPRGWEGAAGRSVSLRLCALPRGPQGLQPRSRREGSASACGAARPLPLRTRPPVGGGCGAAAGQVGREPVGAGGTGTGLLVHLEPSHPPRPAPLGRGCGPPREMGLAAPACRAPRASSGLGKSMTFKN